jgi:alkylation response protein AidB-like acyl-CoA dehydrogenase
MAAQHVETSLVEAARRIGSEARAHSEEIEAARRLPAPFVKRLVEAGLLRLCVPRSLGGPEASARTLLEVCEALAYGDASVGWCAMIASTSSVLAGYLDPATAREIYGAPDAVTGGVFAPRGRARRSGDGFRVTGRWSFASGCEHSSWLMGGCLVEGPDGPERVPGGAPDVRLLLFPAGEARIHDTWNVAGLAGTGSHDIEVADLAVPASRGISLATDRPRESGPLFAFPVFGLLAVGVAGVALGIARRAIDEILALAPVKTPAFAARKLAERGASQTQVAEAEAECAAGRAYLLETLEAVDAASSGGGGIALPDRARLRIAATHAVRSSARCVDRMYELAGASSIYRASALQRLFRDVHVLTQHAMVAPPTYELAGRVLLGLETDTSQI